MNPTILALLCFAGMLHAQTNQGNCSTPFTVGTYNVLQIAFSPFRDERLGALTDLLTIDNQDMQVLCLQELWQESDRQAVISGLQSLYPYSYFAPRFPQTQCNGGCRGEEIQRLRNCLDKNDHCINIFDDKRFTDCIQSNCRNEMESVSATCATCLTQGGDIGSIFRNLDNCLSDDNISQNQTCFAFEGWSDSLILSKIPFVATDFLHFTQSPITYTTALYAAMDTPAFGRLNFFCTHLLPADLPVLTFEQSNNLNQTQELLNWVDTKSGTNETIVLAGDFNHGPGNWPDNYDVVINAGYSSAYTTVGNRNCTYCASNPLASDLTAIIDHIYVRNAHVVSSRRFATFEEYSLSPRDKQIPISDHYGVRADLCPGETQPGVLSTAITVQDLDVFPQDSAALTSVPKIALLASAVVLCLL